jgi:hypothetical protein
LLICFLSSARIFHEIHVSGVHYPADDVIIAVHG